MRGFGHIPRKLFLIRLVLPSLLLFLAGWLLVGAIGKNAPGLYHSNGRTPSYAVMQPEGGVWSQAIEVYRKFWEGVRDFPVACRAGDYSNDAYRREYCSQELDQVIWLGMVAGIPFLWILFFAIFGLQQLMNLYQSVMERMLEHEPDGWGVVAEPRHSSWDWFGKFFCLSPVEVRLASGRTVRAYFPVDAKGFRPGQKVPLYNAGRWFRGERWFAETELPKILWGKAASR